MLTDEQRARAEELRTEVATRAGRAAVVELKTQVQHSGGTARELAKVLGVHESTLCRWERALRAAGGRTRRRDGGASQEESKFRMVRVTAETVPAAGAPPTSGGLRVAHAPSGLVIDGLDVDSLAVLLRRMSCCSGR